MYKNILFLFVVVVLNSNPVKSLQDPVIALPQGILNGAVAKTIDGVQYYQFLGIPYAKPPIKELRFKAPVPLDKWNGILDATKEGNQCASRGFLNLTEVLTEDCLFLNVFTKNVSTASLKPVLFWIHGGAFLFGSGSPKQYGPDFFMNEDVVIVTINYRLDLFGFLALSDAPEYQGNAAFKDQVLALKWVQKNINKFGGDPGKVTIFGESAGSFSIHLLVLSPLAKGLFSKAIAQSGVAISQDAIKYSTQDIARSLGLSNRTKEVVLKELSLKSSKQIYELSAKLQNDLGGMKLAGFTIEKNSSEAFLVEPPLQTILKGNYNQVPMIIGYNNYEGTVVDLLGGPRREQEIPARFGYPANSTAKATASRKMRDFYQGGDPELKRLDLLSDKYFISEIFFSARHHVNTSKYPVYLYRFAADSSLNSLKALGRNPKIKGAAHGDDVGYLFKSLITPAIKKGSVEDISRRRMVRLWTNFAKSGNPTPSKDELLNVIWAPLGKSTINLYGIDEKSVQLFTGDFPEKQRIAFWDQLYKESPAGKNMPIL